MKASLPAVLLLLVSGAPLAAQLPPPAPTGPATPTAPDALRGPPLPRTFSARWSEKSRALAMTRTGGLPKSEAAVMRGLRWLQQTQNADGSWSDQHQPAMTGFALLAFLGHGETAASSAFGSNVGRAVDWVLQKGAEFDGRLSFKTEFNSVGVYEHGILTYALAEYYAMSRDERLPGLLAQAVGYIVDGQGPDGGWMYGYDRSQSDTSVSGWQIQALSAAHLTGLDFPGVGEALDKAMVNLQRVQSDDGNFGYRKAGDRGSGNPSLAGVGIYGTLLWKQEKNKVVRDGLTFLVGQRAKSHPLKYKHEGASLYSWYYDTLAFRTYGGASWAKWSNDLQYELASAQSADGSWPPTGGRGHRENEPGVMSATYRTTLCILMLEVFYRYGR